MPRLDPKLVVHHLVVDPKIKPAQQKLCKMHPKVALLVKAELEKMLEEKVIYPIDCSEWISNIVPFIKLLTILESIITLETSTKLVPRMNFHFQI